MCNKLYKILKGHRIASMALFVFLAIIGMAIFAPSIAPYGENEYDYRESYKPPSKEHLLGTDKMGRDVLSRVIFGTRVSLQVAALAVLVGGSVGIIMGVVAGFMGAWIEGVIMRVVDIGLSFPLIMLAILIMGLFGGGKIVTLVLACGISRAPRVARVAHAATKQIKDRDFIDAAQAMGNNSIRIMIKHILPNITAPLIISLTLDFSIIILIEASLSFLGLGIPPPRSSLGGLVSIGREVLRTAPWLSLSGGFAIFIIILSVNLVGDGLRDFLDPKISTR